MNYTLLAQDDSLSVFCQDSQAYLQGEVYGSLAGLTFAVMLPVGQSRLES